MIRLYCARFVQSLIVLALVYTATFWMLMAVPGRPFVGPKNPPPAVVEALERKYHLDGPKYMTFWYYTKGLMHGDLGESIRHDDQSVADMIGDALPCSVVIGALALLVALWFGMGVGTVGAIYKGRWQDALIATVTLLGISLPLFVVAAMVMFLFSQHWPIFKQMGWGSVSQLVMPVLALSIYFLVVISRLTRVSVIEQLSLDYVRTGRAKGLSRGTVISRHVLRNASLPVLSYLGPAAADAITGSFVVEKVFSIPGMGKTFVDACLDGDIPVVLGSVLVFTAIVLLFNFIIDVTYALADPRISVR